ncbi:hypothetical protein WS71_31040 [Burkholderia mayonis]|uniref:Uncharacterized protein n=1 Tax=Burkholderia mayonis TaxID=1385591 RepID=A0A1B4G6E0_9BURK|nr:hypothetical protein WS71_31040 [Burkholderia mayonis]
MITMHRRSCAARHRAADDRRHPRAFSARSPEHGNKRRRASLRTAALVEYGPAAARLMRPGIFLAY